jgi:aminopeptidase N
MSNEQGVTTYRKDYQPVTWLCPKIELEFDLDPNLTVVKSIAQYELREDHQPGNQAKPLALVGNPSARLSEVSLNGVALPSNLFRRHEHSLIIEAGAIAGLKSFALSITLTLSPKENTSNSGLYLSGGNFFTQCEAEGFRQIMFFQDRPDVMSSYLVKLRAAKDVFPALLSNGNLIDSGDLPDGRHFATWQDPFLKPSYLFAVVAGNLVAREETIVRPDQGSKKGKPALLQVWVKPGQLDRTEWAMMSLKAAIKWDRERFGLELDLDRFMVVAVDDFNMGAMENKGLNIFNSALLFAAPTVATDTDYDSIEGVIGHEYFHNWTGNRVTCRDWFQLTLKEGLTVFRDQEFSSDMAAAAAASPDEAASARAVNRIKDVQLVRRLQFAEDAGPMAHPIRPDSYEAIDNFYTMTVYEKGAEVIRMIQTLVGRDGFRRGIDLYFERHDGQAVTCDDFIAAMSDANNIDLTQFKRWYSQAHTPRIMVEYHYDNETKLTQLIFQQKLPEGQKPFHIPVEIGFVNPDGSHSAVSRLVQLTMAEQFESFTGVAAKAVPSLGRGFSAPIYIDFTYSNEQLGLLARADNDPFNRWDATQLLATRAILANYRRELSVSHESTTALVKALGESLTNHQLSPAFKAELLNLPPEALLAEQITDLDPQRLRHARLELHDAIAYQLNTHWPMLYTSHAVTEQFESTPAQAGNRALRNSVLGYWLRANNAKNSMPDAATRKQLLESDNLTDRLGALLASRMGSMALREWAFAQFAKMYGDEPLVMDKWYIAHASAIRGDNDEPILAVVKRLYASAQYDRKNPNRIRSLVGVFFTGNLAEFHLPDGSGYDFFAETVIAVDALNPQIGARLARAFDRMAQYAQQWREPMKAALKKIDAAPTLSPNTREIIGKFLKAAA